MAKPTAPNFRDVDKDATARAQALVQGGRNNIPLTAPDNARVSKNKDNTATYTRWSEQIVINAAYRTTTDKGQLDIVVVGKVRQSDVVKNNGLSLFSHFYSTGAVDEISDGHQKMNEKSDGAIATLLVAAGLMPASGVMKASFLDKMFPEKNRPGAVTSLLVGKEVIANVVKENKAAYDKKTGKAKKDGSRSERDGAESFLPVATEE